MNKVDVCDIRTTRTYSESDGDGNSSDKKLEREQNRHLVKAIILCVIPLVVLIVVVIFRLMDQHDVRQNRQIMKNNVLTSSQIIAVIHNLQLERSMTVYYLSSRRTEDTLTQLHSQYNSTDNIIQYFNNWPVMSSPTKLRSKITFNNYLNEYRSSIHQKNKTVKNVITFYTDCNVDMIKWVLRSLKNYKNGPKWELLVGYHSLTVMKEQSCIERELGSLFYSSTELFSHNTFLWYHRIITLQDKYMARSKQYSSKARNMIEMMYSETNLKNNIVSMRSAILRNTTSTKSVDRDMPWFGNMTGYISVLKMVQDALGQDIIKVLEEDIDTIEGDLILTVLTMIGSFILTAVIVLGVYKLTKKLQSYAHSLHRKTYCLEHERKRSESLLYQMLPVTVAEKLIKNQLVKPESFSSVTVYFSDIVGFSTICNQRTPIQVVEMLNLIYETFDDHLELFDVYKVETIGDAYMVASGLPQPIGDRHVAEISGFALDIMDTIAHLYVPHLHPEKLAVRIGINTGPVVAGVVGHKMPRYCLFGDTVNVASRMQSSGLPSKIQMSGPSYKALLHYPHLIAVERGIIHIKGKGSLKTYWLVGRTDINVRVPEVTNSSL